MRPASYSEDTYSHDELIAGHLPPLVEKVTLTAGESRTRGAVLGKVTASGEYKLSAAAAGDGSETPTVVLAEDCDATDGDKECLVYTRADVASHMLTLGAGHTVASIKAGLADRGIHIISTSEA